MLMPIIIEKMKKKEVKNVYSIINKCYPEDDNERALIELNAAFENGWIMPQYYVLKNEENTSTSVIAVGAFSEGIIDWDGYCIFWIAVNPLYQHMGYGKKIIEHLLLQINKHIKKYKKEVEYCTIQLSCIETLAPFYEKYGFNRIMKKKGGFIMGKNI